MNRAIRVGLVDDHSITRAALRGFIREQDDMVVAGEGWDDRSAIELARESQVDVLLLDIQMPGRGGLAALPIICAKAPDMGVLVLSSCPQEHYALSAIRLGASGYLNKQCDPEEILGAIRKIASGRRYLSVGVAELLATTIATRAARPPHEQLTDREFELFVRFARGFKTSEVAATLFLTPKTVSAYRTAILGKLGLRSNAEMTHYALTHGLVD